MKRRITAKMRRLSHSPAANRKRAAAQQRVLAYRAAYHIPAGTKLTKAQKKAAHSLAPDPAIRTGSVPIGEIDRRNKPKPGAQSEQRRYLTSKRVELAAEVTSLVKKLDAQLAASFLHVLKALLNGGAH